MKEILISYFYVVERGVKKLVLAEEDVVHIWLIVVIEDFGFYSF